MFNSQQADSVSVSSRLHVEPGGNDDMEELLSSGAAVYSVITSSLAPHQRVITFLLCFNSKHFLFMLAGRSRTGEHGLRRSGKTEQLTLPPSVSHQ